MHEFSSKNVQLIKTHGATNSWKEEVVYYLLFCFRRNDLALNDADIIKLAIH